jgi:protein-disulfide isomerase
MKSYAERLSSWLLTFAALVMAAAVVRRELHPAASRRTQAAAAPEFHSDWASLRAAGVEVGDAGGRIKIVEFVDFECPACRHYHLTVLSQFKNTFGLANISHVLVHLPLRIHRFAQAAAAASECARQEGVFASYVDALFARQDSLGLKPWQAYAKDAGVRDTLSFASCLRAPPSERIRAGIAFADSLGIHATPTVFVNGWQYAVPPSLGELSRLAERILAGAEPAALNAGSR